MKIKIRGIEEHNRIYKKIQDRLTGGHPLWVRTGRLRASILVNTERQGKLVRGEVGTNVFYGKILEVDGVGKKKKKYPFLGPSFREKKNMIKQEINNALRRIYGK